jgi:hypothetical protein
MTLADEVDMRWSLFRSRSFLASEAEASHYNAWAWLLRHFGGIADLLRSPLVQPTRAFFPPTETTGQARGEHIFACVKRHARVTDWPCRVVAQAPRPELRVGELATLEFAGSQAAGTFSLHNNEAIITYDPVNLDDPFKLVATFAHEVAHYKLAGIAEEPPDSPDSLETITDLTTVYLGFGLFGANCAFNFSQHQSPLSQGWSWSRLGYLGERDWVFALAVFLMLRGEAAAELRPFLKSHLFADLGKALAYLRHNPTLVATLRSQ